MPFKLLSKSSEALSISSSQSLQSSDYFLANSSNQNLQSSGYFIANNRMYFKKVFCDLTPKLKISIHVQAYFSQHFCDLNVPLQYLPFTKIVPDVCISLIGIKTWAKNCIQVLFKLTGISIKSQKDEWGEGLPQLRLTHFFFAFNFGIRKTKGMLWFGIAIFAFAYQ